MKGKPFVIGLIIGVIIIVGAVTLAMMLTINGMKKEQQKDEQSHLPIESIQVTTASQTIV
ncbi:hypothetical protein IRY55_06765 [Savagea sp. SN6]|uniref:Uncharacterized protein n=1 Tax=Savagea serpentis TaxID=2785297 RepID=A0A8J7G8D6_9BACL|nr:hypothetical protein [Savagea serpentis]MBF4501063.1 hypothetical protein [Savagea serpentis]